MDIQVKQEAMEEDWNVEADEYVAQQTAAGKSVVYCPPTRSLPPEAQGVKYGKKKKKKKNKSSSACSAAPGPSKAQQMRAKQSEDVQPFMIPNDIYSKVVFPLGYEQKCLLPCQSMCCFQPVLFKLGVKSSQVSVSAFNFTSANILGTRSRWLYGGFW